MPPDTVQIGPLVISKIVFDSIIVLASVIVGGLVTFLTTRAIEIKKWNEQKRERIQEHRRQALSLALEWIPPMTLALTEASMLTSRYLKGETTDNDFRKLWPNLLSELAKRDLPMRLIVLVPPEIQRRTNDILAQLDELRASALLSAPRKQRSIEEWTRTYKSLGEQATLAQARLEELKSELISEYKNTFK